MKILQITGPNSLGGLSRYVEDLDKSLNKQGCESIVLHFKETVNYLEILKNG